MLAQPWDSGALVGSLGDVLRHVAGCLRPGLQGLEVEDTAEASSERSSVHVLDPEPNAGADHQEDVIVQSAATGATALTVLDLDATEVGIDAEAGQRQPEPVPRSRVRAVPPSQVHPVRAAAPTVTPLHTGQVLLMTRIAWGSDGQEEEPRPSGTAVVGDPVNPASVPG